MRIFEFWYRGGEIIAYVEAETRSEAMGKLGIGDVPGRSIVVGFWYLHKEFWQYVEEHYELEED